MKLIRLTLRGLSPGMLQNPATEDLLEQLRTKKSVPKNRELTVEQEAGAKLYRSDKGLDGSPGKMGIPSLNLMAAIVAAGQHVKNGKKGISTAKSTTVYDFLEIVEDFLPFDSCNAEGNIPWIPNKSKGTMHQGSSETAVCIVRPRIVNWGMTVVMRFDDKRNVSDATLKELIETAGRKVGLCDWRPAKRGKFGRFVITKMEFVALKETAHKIQEVQYTEEDAPADMRQLLAAAA